MATIQQRQVKAMIERMIERMKRAKDDERSFVTLPMVGVLFLMGVLGMMLEKFFIG